MCYKIIKERQQRKKSANIDKYKIEMEIQSVYGAAIEQIVQLLGWRTN
jgi:hypothetical protein